MPTRNGSGSANSLKSDSGPYGGAEYRAREAARSGGDTTPTMKEIREQLNDDVANDPELGRYADRVKNMMTNIFSPVSKQTLLDKFNRDVGDVQFNPYRPFTDFVEKDVTREITDKLNTFVAYRDLLEGINGKTQELKALDDAIRDYAGTAVYYRNNLEAALESGDTETARNAEALNQYNRAALYVKNALQDAILPSKRGPRNG